jgi:hypothetical protein
MVALNVDTDGFRRTGELVDSPARCWAPTSTTPHRCSPAPPILHRRPSCATQRAPNGCSGTCARLGTGVQRGHRHERHRDRLRNRRHGPPPATRTSSAADPPRVPPLIGMMGVPLSVTAAPASMPRRLIRSLTSAVPRRNPGPAAGDWRWPWVPAITAACPVRRVGGQSPGRQCQPGERVHQLLATGESQATPGMAAKLTRESRDRSRRRSPPRWPADTKRPAPCIP